MSVCHENWLRNGNINGVMSWVVDGWEFQTVMCMTSEITRNVIFCELIILIKQNI